MTGPVTDTDRTAAQDVLDRENGSRDVPNEPPEPTPPDQESDEEALSGSSWRPVDLAAVSLTPEEPTILQRSDGLCLLYPGRIHWVSGEPESLKTWLLLLAVVGVLKLGGRALIVDYEDDAAGFIARLAALGVDAVECHRAGRLLYVNPTEGFMTHDGRYTPGHLAFAELCAWQPTLAVIDGVTTAMELEGLDPGSNPDAAKWIAAVPRPLARSGAAAACIDHVTKTTEGRGRWAIGAQHKLAGVDGASYTVEVIRPLGRAMVEPIEALARVNIAKDRRGYIRGRLAGQKVAADLTITSYPDGGLSCHVAAPGKAALDEHQRRVVEHLAVYEGASKKALRELGNSDSIDAAILALVGAGDVVVSKVGASHQHSLTDAGRERWETAP